jgi:tetratricopeptide (TPR) repeat protein
LQAVGRAGWTLLRWVFASAKDLIAFLSLVTVVTILIYLYSLTAHVVIEDFQVPEELSKKGYSGAVIANRVRDGIRSVVATAGEEGGDRFSGAAPKDSVKVLDTELPITFIVELLRSILGLQVSRISGDVVQVTAADASINYTITLRIDSQFCAPRTCIFAIPASDLEKGLREVTFDALEKIDPYELAVYYLRNRMIREAEGLIDAFMREKEVSEADRYNVKGGILRRSGKTEDAKSAYDAARSKNPNNPTPYFNLAELLRDEGRFKEALHLYEEALKFQGGAQSNAEVSSDLYAGLGSAYGDLAFAERDENLRHREKQMAVENFNKSIALDGKNSRPYTGLGNLSLGDHEFNQAIAFYRRALNLDPNSAQASYGLAECLLALGDKKSAIALYEGIIKFSEDHFTSAGKFESLARERVKALGAPPKKK